MELALSLSLVLCCLSFFFPFLPQTQVIVGSLRRELFSLLISVEFKGNLCGE